jgi:hypothetical protein
MPSATLILHLPQVMLPEQGASMGTPTDFATSKSDVFTDDSA